MTTYKKDITGDGMIGAIYYNRGHVKIKHNLISKILVIILAIELLFIVFLILGNVFYVNSAQNVLNTVIAGIK